MTLFQNFILNFIYLSLSKLIVHAEKKYVSLRARITQVISRENPHTFYGNYIIIIVADTTVL